MDRLPRLAALLLCAGLLPGAAMAGDEADAAPPAPEASLITLVTIDLDQDRDDWPRRRMRIVEEMRRLQPGAIALQDVLQHESLPNQADWLARELGYEVHFVTADPPSHKRRQGNALLTRGEVLEEGETLLHPLEDRRTAGLVRLSVDGRPLNIYFTRLHRGADGAEMRARQLADLLAYVDATAGQAPSVIAGTFNAGADAPELAPLQAGWQDAWGALHPQAGATGTGTAGPGSLDAPVQAGRIFVERGRIEAVEAELLFDATDAGDAGNAGEAADANDAWTPAYLGLLARLRIEDAVH